MNTFLEKTRRWSRWTYAACLLFCLSLLAFGLFWFRPESSGVGQMISRGMAVLLFAGLLCAAAVCLLVGVFRARRRGWSPSVPLAAIGLGLCSLAFATWTGYGLRTPERLVLSARRGNLDAVALSLRAGVDVDATFEELLGFGGKRRSETALEAAACAGHLDLMRLLLDSGADVEGVDAPARTILDAAIGYGQVEAARALLQAGATVATQSSSPDGRSERPTSLAVALGAATHVRDYPLEPLLDLLIAAGADPSPWPLRRQALWLEDNEAALALLRSAEAAGQPDPSASGWTELLDAVALGETERARELHAGLAENAGDRGVSGSELLHLGAKFGHAGFVRHLLDGGVAVDSEWNGRTPLHQAGLQGHEQAAELLLAAGADRAAQDAQGRTAAEAARARGHEELAQILAGERSD